jgi:Heterokaryon incompatibility protein (HET)
MRSYTLGDPSATTKVVLNVEEVDVTANLGAALVRLRDDGYSKPWVDALCINRRDNKELGAQVQLTSLIYRKADEVTAWLGIEADGA